jgi:hypothetical protein
MGSANEEAGSDAASSAGAALMCCLNERQASRYRWRQEYCVRQAQEEVVAGCFKH